MRRWTALGVVLAMLCGACAPVPLARETTFHPSDADLAITHVVHGTFVLEFHGTRLLVDPWFHSGFLTRQHEALGLTPATLPAVTAILLTSEEADHFDATALHDLAATVPRAIAPPALRQRLVELGFREVTGLAWWERTEVEGVTITALPSSVGPRANGYALVSHDARVYVAGPTAPMDGFVDIAVAFPNLDVAILPIGGQRVFGMVREMTPEQAAVAAVTLGAARVMPSEYGASSRAPWVWHTGGALDRFRSAMAERGLGDRVVALQSGESWHYVKP